MQYSNVVSLQQASVVSACFSCLCREEVRGAKIESLSLDLADLQSVRDMASRCLDMGHPLDVLINNAVRVKSVLSAQLVLVQIQKVGNLATVAAPGPLRRWGYQASGPFSWPERAEEAYQLSLPPACRRDPHTALHE